MKFVLPTCAAAALLFAAAGCFHLPGSRAAKARFEPPALPSTPPPVPGELKAFIPPLYPAAERKAGTYGEVLVELTINGNERVTGWKILRSTTSGFARVVSDTMPISIAMGCRAPGVPAGVYAYSVVFNGANRRTAPDRPATFWITTQGFGQR